MSDNIRFVWYSSDEPEIIGSIDVKSSGYFNGKIDDPRVKRMLDAGLFLDMGFTARADVPAKPAEESNIVSHARRELEIIGEEPEMIAAYLKVVQAFADMHASGGQASVAIPVLNILFCQKNISAITDYPDDWQYHDPSTWGGPVHGKGIWQSKRNSEIFSENGGKTYYISRGAGRSLMFESKPDKRNATDVVPDQPLS